MQIHILEIFELIFEILLENIFDYVGRKNFHKNFLYKNKNLKKIFSRLKSFYAQDKFD